MKIVTSHAENEIDSLARSIASDTNWLCLRVEMPSLIRSTARGCVNAEIRRIIGTTMKNGTGTAFLCGFHETLVFSKGNAGDLRSVGEQVMELVAAVTGVPAPFRVHDLSPENRERIAAGLH
jgi:hypothetical protein